MLQQSAFTLSTMTGGGAIYHMQACQSIAYLQWLGRWSSEKSVSHYLQLGLAASAMAGIPASARTLVLRMAELAPVLLNQSLIPQPATQPATREDGWAAAADSWNCVHQHSRHQPTVVSAQKESSDSADHSSAKK
eukprot:6364985-Amphidinium_carterae.1